MRTTTESIPKITATPLGDRILVLPDEKVTTDFGLILPEQSQKPPQTGTVIGVGDENYSKLKKGDHILYSNYAGTEIQLDGTAYRVMREVDVWLILNKS